MSDRNLTEQLKSLKSTRAGGAPDARWLLSSKEILMMQIENNVGVAKSASGVKSFSTFFQVFMPENLARWAAVPALVLALMVGSNLGASALVLASAKTLPGDTLYDVKLAAEQFTLKFTTASTRVTRRLEVAGRRMDEMVRLSASIDARKDAKIARVAGLFSDTMNALSADLAKLEQGDASAAVRAAVLIDERADEFQSSIQTANLRSREGFRMAQVSLDLASVSALELMVAKHEAAPSVLADAEFSSTIGRGVQRFVDTSVAAVPNSPQVRKVAEEAQELFTQGDFKAAIRKVVEGTELANSQIDSASSTASTTNTLDVPATEPESLATEEVSAEGEEESGPSPSNEGEAGRGL